MIMILPLTIATLPADPTLGDVVQFVLNGLFVVVVALSILALGCSLIGWAIRQLTVQPLATTPTATPENELHDRTIAVIAAAVATVIDSPHRIVHVRGLTPEDAGWALQGRMQHHTSHTLPHRDQR